MRYDTPPYDYDEEEIEDDDVCVHGVPFDEFCSECEEYEPDLP